MTNSPNSHKNVFKDIAWYLLGAAIPIIVSLLRSPIFTRYFTPEEYGNYSIVFISISIVSVFLYAWLSNSVWRFYFKYKKSGELSSFYPSIIVFILLATIIFSLLVFPWAHFEDSRLISRLLILIFLQTFVNQFVSFILIIIRLENKSGLYNSIHSLRAILSFLVQLVLTFQFNFRIEAIPIATMATELFILLFLARPVLKNVSINFKKVNKKILFEIGKYSAPGIATSLGSILLTSSDRYIISIYCDMRQVGIYNQIYNFSQISVMAIVQVFFSVINPDFLKALEYRPKEIYNYLVRYYKYYLMLILPIAVYISLFAKPISIIFFGEDFREGYDMIPLVVFSAFIGGFLLFRDNKFKFEKKYRVVIIGFIIATVTNVVLNFALIPLYGYKMAALTTLVSYSVLYLYYYFNDPLKLFQNRPYLMLTIKTTGVLLLQVMIDFSIKKIFTIEAPIVFSIIEGLLFIGMYYLLILKSNIQLKKVAIVDAEE